MSVFRSIVFSAVLAGVVGLVAWALFSSDD
jgi:hypothetical protein